VKRKQIGADRSIRITHGKAENVFNICAFVKFLIRQDTVAKFSPANEMVIIRFPIIANTETATSNHEAEVMYFVTEVKSFVGYLPVMFTGRQYLELPKCFAATV
jgi:hypothetical protein